MTTTNGKQFEEQRDKKSPINQKSPQMTQKPTIDRPTNTTTRNL
jgi:hypothetical protein